MCPVQVLQAGNIVQAENPLSWKVNKVHKVALPIGARRSFRRNARRRSAFLYVSFHGNSFLNAQWLLRAQNFAAL